MLKKNIFGLILALALLINLIFLILNSVNVYLSEGKHINKRICQLSLNCFIAITFLFVFVDSLFKLTISWNFFRTTMFIFNLTSLIATVIVTLLDTICYYNW